MKINLYLVITLFMTTATFGQSDQNPKHSSAAEKTANALRKKIQIEAKSSNVFWAGDYYAGDGLGVNTSLSIAPKSGFVFEWHGCMGLYDRNYGSVACTNGRICFAFAFPNQRKGFQGLAPELIPVSWGPRRYLIPADDIIGFCNQVNRGSEPRQDVHGVYLLRDGDEKKPAPGSPELPGDFRPYLLAEPALAEIISVGNYKTTPSVADWKFKDTPVTLNAGSNDGLRVGMELLVVYPENTVESVRITKVENKNAEGVMTQIGEDAPGPKVGWRLSTEAPWLKSKLGK